MSNKQKNKKEYVAVGGQALMEGIMMRGPQGSAMALRLPDGGVGTEYPQKENGAPDLFKSGALWYNPKQQAAFAGESNARCGGGKRCGFTEKHFPN